LGRTDTSSVHIVSHGVSVTVTWAGTSPGPNPCPQPVSKMALTLTEPPATSTTDAGVTPHPSARALSIWLFLVAGLVAVMVVVGGATRLTQSGLSMVHWEPVSGTIPPLSESDWQREFDAYRATPEFQKVNSHMDLADFKGIFWWEYSHRVLGRIVGLAMALPFGWFMVRRKVPAGYGGRIAFMVALVGFQGFIGWWMVASGLVDRPDVAHERLALHLSTALLLLCALIWTALDLRALSLGRAKVAGRPSRWVVPHLVLLTTQIVLGAFVAGLNAGHIYTTWPTMQGRWVPREIDQASPVWSNAVDNPVAVQFLHRWLAVVVVASTLVVAVRLYQSGARKLAGVLEAAVLVQFALGVLTLINAVPVGLGIAHQAGGAILLVVTVVAAHWSTGGARPSRPAVPTAAVAV